MLRSPTRPPLTGISRRAFISAAGIAVTGIVLPRAAQTQALQAGQPGPDGFQVLRAKLGIAALRGEEQPSTPTWGYEGLTPGPLLRVRKGDELKIRLVNGLAEPTALHWHGLRLPNAMDGTPHLTQPPVVPGASFDYRFTARDAGTFWYHAPLLAADQVARGLYGVLIVEEPQPLEFDREVVLVLDEWRLTSEGAYDPVRGAAEYLTVNSRPNVTIPVRSNERIRLRLLSAAVTRLLGLRIDGHPVTVMAVDGQPAEPFAAKDSRIMLGPGNRIDVFVDATFGPGVAAPIVLETDKGEIPIARLVYDHQPGVRTQTPAFPKPLPPNPLPERMDFARALKLELTLDGSAIRESLREPGGRGAAPRDPQARLWTPAAEALAGRFGAALFPVKRGRTVMLALINPTATAQSVHLHGHSFRLLDALDDGWKPFWLDTLAVAPRQTVRIAFVADAPGKWLIHAQALAKPQTDGMAAWFEVS
jgi:FtsP/CotA-like multicopper oxidase with cupredoxin domain